MILNIFNFAGSSSKFHSAVLHALEMFPTPENFHFGPTHEKGRLGVMQKLQGEDQNLNICHF